MTAPQKGELIALNSRGRKRAEEHSLTLDPVIGKDILELLSSAMYVDPLTVYREYVQNSADSIDDAFTAGLLAEPNGGRIDVYVDPQARSIRVLDNGIGLAAADAERVLTSFGASPKRDKDARGFRGVGRLSALGYAQSVAFRTKAMGEAVSTEVRWDCRRLKSALLDPTYHGDLRQIVRDVVSVIIHDEPEKERHYFEVSLEKVVRIKNDLLLNSEEVGRYLSEVVPAPFRDDFPFTDAILQSLRVHVPPCRFEVFLNGCSESMKRPHRREFALSKTKTDVVTSLEHIEIQDGEGGLRAIGWLLHHSYLGAIHAADELRGLRARVGNIQIGTGEVFAEVFLEPRFNSWTIGELHILDRRIIPNARRDNFEQSVAYSDLLAQLAQVARGLSKRCRDSSARRHRLRGFVARDQRIQECFALLAQRGIPQGRDTRLRREIGALLGEMTKIARSSVLADTDSARMHRRVAVLEERRRSLKEVSNASDPFASLEKRRRAAYRDIVSLIYDCSANQKAANLLVGRIIERIAGDFTRARQIPKRTAKHGGSSKK
jgi:molecular chaperone HtpG